MAGSAEAEQFVDLVGPLEEVPDGAGATRPSFVAARRHLDGHAHVHTGMLMAFADHVLAARAREAAGQPVATISLNVDVIAPVTEGARVEGRATITRRTKSLVFVTGELHAGGRAVASANGVCKVVAP
jgi:uncharacterized protein (TIGR00369 family)